MDSKKNKSIKGTKTEKNLVNAYMSESAAYSRYKIGRASCRERV